MHAIAAWMSRVTRRRQLRPCKIAVAQRACPMTLLNRARSPLSAFPPGVSSSKSFILIHHLHTDGQRTRMREGKPALAERQKQGSVTRKSDSGSAVCSATALSL